MTYIPALWYYLLRFGIDVFSNVSEWLRKTNRAFHPNPKSGKSLKVAAINEGERQNECPPWQIAV